MTTTTTTPRPPAPGRQTGSPALRAVLLVDGWGTAAVGVAAMALAEPLADDVAGAGVLSAVGVLFVVAGLDMVLARRLSGRRLSLAGRAFGVLDLVVAAVCVASLAVLDTTALGTALVLGVAVTCLGMGAAKLRLA